MKTFREQLRDHQLATDCTDDHMVGILCDFIEKMDNEDGPVGDYMNELTNYVVERLERGPMDIPVPNWRLPMFTEEDQELIVTRVMEEIADCSVKDLAHSQLEGEDLVECIGYALPAAYEAEHMASMLQHLANEEDTYVSGEFLREHDDDGDDYAGQLDFAKRMGLINDDETELTERGVEFVSRFT